MRNNLKSIDLAYQLFRQLCNVERDADNFIAAGINLPINHLKEITINYFANLREGGKWISKIESENGNNYCKNSLLALSLEMTEIITQIFGEKSEIIIEIPTLIVIKAEDEVLINYARHIIHVWENNLVFLAKVGCDNLKLNNFKDRLFDYIIALGIEKQKIIIRNLGLNEYNETTEYLYNKLRYITSLGRKVWTKFGNETKINEYKIIRPENFFEYYSSICKTTHPDNVKIIMAV